ncbi:MAG: peptidyl-alpha-hydroxyglycine alpha-amidating lyase family protein, partial [Bacteroidota bacterium]
MTNRLLLFILFSSLTACSNSANETEIKDAGILSSYQLVKDWPQLPLGYSTGSPAGIGIDSNQHIFIFTRAGREWPLLMPMPATLISGKTILEVDNKTGELINSWGAHFFIMPHGLTVDMNNNIWVTDAGLHQVFKFSHAGKLLMELGTAGVAGDDSVHFNQPTDVAIAKDGSVYVSDGYGNSRVVKFSPEGKYVLQWGKKGNGPGEFNIPHAIDLDDNGGVYVADRQNQRIQVFDSSGHFLKELTNKSFGNLCSIVFDKKEKHVIAVDDLTSFEVKHTGSDVIVFDSTETSFKRFGRSGGYDGAV